MNRAVFLDRDGVINELVNHGGEFTSPFTLEEFKILPGVKEAIRELKKMNFKVIVASNQPDVVKGNMKEETLKKITQKIKDELRIDEVYYCLHHPKFTGECNCRKPKPGLLLKAAEDLNIDLEESYMIGDSISDIKAGETCKKNFLIKTNSNKVNFEENKPDYIVSDLFSAVKIIKELEGF